MKYIINLKLLLMKKKKRIEIINNNMNDDLDWWIKNSSIVNIMMHWCSVRHFGINNNDIYLKKKRSSVVISESTLP